MIPQMNQSSDGHDARARFLVGGDGTVRDITGPQSQPLRIEVGPGHCDGAMPNVTPEMRSTNRFWSATRLVAVLFIASCALWATWQWNSTDTSSQSLSESRPGTLHLPFSVPFVEQPLRQDENHEAKDHQSAERQSAKWADSSPDISKPDRSADRQLTPKDSPKPSTFASTKQLKPPPPSERDPRAAIVRLAFYIDRAEALPFSPESVVGFNLANYGVEPRVWNRFSTELRLTTIYNQLEFPKPGSGEQGLAMLAWALAQEYEDARHDPALQPYLKLEVVTSKPSNSSDRQPAPDVSSNASTRSPEDKLATLSPAERKWFTTMLAIDKCARYFDLSKGLAFWPELYFGANRADFPPRARKWWDNASTTQRLEKLYFQSEKTQTGAGARALVNLSSAILHLHDGDRNEAALRAYVASVKATALPKTSLPKTDPAIESEVSAVIGRCAFYLDNSAAIVLSPESLVGFNPADYGLNAHDLDLVPTVPKIKMLYLAAERAVPGSGERLFALLCRALAQAYGGPKLEPAFLRYFELEAVPTNVELRFELPEPPIPRPLGPDEIAKYRALIKYQRGARLGGPFVALQRTNNLTALEAAKLWTATRSFEGAIAYQLAIMQPMDRQQWFLLETKRALENYGGVLLEPSLQREIASLQRQPLPQAIRQFGLPGTIPFIQPLPGTIPFIQPLPGTIPMISPSLALPPPVTPILLPGK